MPTSRVTCGNVIQGKEQRESQGCAIVEHPSPRASYQPLACVLCSESEQVMLPAVITWPHEHGTCETACGICPESAIEARG